jgi:hypothetical protein
MNPEQKWDRDFLMTNNKSWFAQHFHMIVKIKNRHLTFAR